MTYINKYKDMYKNMDFAYNLADEAVYARINYKEKRKYKYIDAYSKENTPSSYHKCANNLMCALDLFLNRKVVPSV